MCWLLAASSASSAMFSIHFLLSTFILLLTSLSFSVYFALSCLLTLSDRVLRIFLLISSLCSTSFYDASLVNGSSTFLVYLELFLQPQCTPSPSLESHALFLRHPLLLALHPQVPDICSSMSSRCFHFQCPQTCKP